MSKVSFSRELLGTIRFVFDKTKSRNLNATQAYDKSTSQIVLASYPATSTIKAPAKSLGRDDLDSGKTYGDVNVTGTQNPALQITVPTEKANLTGPEAPKTINVGLVAYGAAPEPVPSAKQTAIIVKPPTTAKFCGTLVRAAEITPGDPDAIKSNATKDIFAGNITVGTGLYRTWQGKYAVLKVDLLTDKAILRVYNE